MAQGDIKFFSVDKFGIPSAQTYQVEAGTADILPGELVNIDTASRQYVLPAGDGETVIGTDEIVGIAQNFSTQTAGDDGVVSVHTAVPGVVYIAKAKDPSAIATQAAYDALVGSRVLISVVNGEFLVDESVADNANNAILIRDLDIENHPGKVAFEIRSTGTIRN